MIDLAPTVVAKSDQLNADDLYGGPITVEVDKVLLSSSAEQPVVLHYKGENGRPYKPCKTMRRVLIGVWGNDATKYAGRAMTLFRDPDVTFGGDKVGGIRITHMSGIDREVSVPVQITRGVKRAYKVKPLRDASPAAQERPASNGRADGARSAVPLSDHVEAAKDALIKAVPHGADEVEAKWSGAKMVALKERLRAPEHADLLMDLTEVYTSAKSAASASELEGAF